MVNFEAFDKIKKVLLDFSFIEIYNNKTNKFDNNYSLIMFVPVENLKDRYTLFLSSPRLDDLSSFKVLEKLVPFMREKLEDSDYLKIWRYTFVKSTDPLIKNLNYIFKTDKNLMDVNNIRIGDNYIEKAYIVLSQNLEEQHA